MNYGYRLGSNGTGVEALQQQLMRLGYYHGRIDGDFGTLTEDAVKAFQSTANLNVDGWAGPDTLAAIRRTAIQFEPKVDGVPEDKDWFVDNVGMFYQHGGRVEYRQAHDHSGPMLADPQVLVLHYDAGRQASAVDILTRADDIYISAQLSLGRAGNLIQMLPLNYVAWHAGDGHALNNRVNYHGKSINYTAIGIEMENLGWLNKSDGENCWREWGGASSLKVPIDQCVEAVHPLRNQKFWWPKWTEIQYESMKGVIQAILDRYPSIVWIVGHDQISTQKFDPGPAFYMEHGGIKALVEEFGRKGL